MIQCTYVGSGCSQIDDREFDAVGQRASMSENNFREAVLGGAAFIPTEDFAKIEFTEEEICRFGPMGSRFDPSASFCNKLMLAQQLYRDLRNRMSTDSEEILAEVSEV